MDQDTAQREERPYTYQEFGEALICAIEQARRRGFYGTLQVDPVPQTDNHWIVTERTQVKHHPECVVELYELHYRPGIGIVVEELPL